jgi:hypothetical protein
VRDHRDRLSASDVSQVEEVLNQAKSILHTGTTADLKQAHERLSQAIHAISEKLYSSTGRPPEPPPPGSDTVVDAEYK